MTSSITKAIFGLQVPGYHQRQQGFQKDLTIMNIKLRRGLHLSGWIKSWNSGTGEAREPRAFVKLWDLDCEASSIASDGARQIVIRVSGI